MSIRPPIVVVLGHVDHGKSSLLEAIREDFKITSKESGGITQHIGAYVAQYNGKPITFIDTPGHEAFSAMRARGAKVADIAILVVAADDGVQPQTKEAIEVIKQAKLPFIVAINKIDKPEGKVEQIKSELAKLEVFVESIGGTVPSVGTSAKTKQGIKELLELILLMADLENLQANEDKPGEGVIIESYVDTQRGSAATAILLDGTLRAGSIVGTHTSFGKAHILEDSQGEPVDRITPSMPGLVIGFEKNPHIGEEFKVFKTEVEAQAFLLPEQQEEKTQKPLPEGGKILSLILKADVAGSLEVLKDMLFALPQDKVILKIASSGVGEVNETDVRLAQGLKARVFAFRSATNKGVQDFATREHISIERFDIVYDLLQRVRQLLEQEAVEAIPQRMDIGTLRVLGVFFTEKSRQIIGGRVLEGEVQKGANIEVMRKEAVAGKGKALGLQKDKKDAQKVEAGSECGISYEGNVQVEVGDILQFYTM